MKKERVKYLLDKSFTTIKEEGIKSFILKTNNFITLRRKKMKFSCFKDVLIINGCTLPHPERYRVDHQIEQLEAYGLTANKVYYENLNLDMLKYYRAFIFFRCPITPIVNEFIDNAHYYNKKVFFDIDDLVINTKYTDTIPFVNKMSIEDKKIYDDGVIRMEQTLKKCDYILTTTEALKKELESYGKEVLINRNVASEKMAELSLKAIEKVEKDPTKIVLGYLSGSITHNPDFELIKDAILRVMEEHNNVYLRVVGLLDIPKEFEKYKDRVLNTEFVDWQKLPEIIRSLDINLAPITKSIFNAAKSENKWTEASLCKVITLASNYGAFKTSIVDGKTGILCDDDEWYDKLNYAVTNLGEMNKIAENAYREVIKHKITTYTGLELKEFIESKLVKNFGFVLPSTNISGGVNVIIKHCNILRNHGYDVTIISMGDKSNNIVGRDGVVPVISTIKSDVVGRFDTLVASLWATLFWVKDYPQVLHKKYLVQNFETDFGKIGQGMRLAANSTYNSLSDIEYLTISKWCKDWLKKGFHKNCKYAPNGINEWQFKYSKRDFKGKIRILVEGNSDDYYKNVDESFKIVQKLDKNKYEIHFLSYQGTPKDWYYVDKFYHRVPYDEVGKIYSNADILIKSSILESFSYPPLEMMATGGVCLVVPNDGNVEYLQDNYNCLFYEQGNIDMAVAKLEEIARNITLREKLTKNGIKTVKERYWENIEEQILNLYL